jgi:hypothetical protein
VKIRARESGRLRPTLVEKNPPSEAGLAALREAKLAAEDRRKRERREALWRAARVWIKFLGLWFCLSGILRFMEWIGFDAEAHPDLNYFLAMPLGLFLAFYMVYAGTDGLFDK